MNKIVRRIVNDADLRRKLIELCAEEKKPLTQQAISEWKKSKSGIPPSRVLIVCKLLDLLPHQIRPDIFPRPVRRRKPRNGNLQHAQQHSLFERQA